MQQILGRYYRYISCETLVNVLGNPKDLMGIFEKSRIYEPELLKHSITETWSIDKMLDEKNQV